MDTVITDQIDAHTAGANNVTFHLRHGGTVTGTASRPTYDDPDHDPKRAYLVVAPGGGKTTLVHLGDVVAVSVDLP